jgi:hypothetical protein
MGRCIGLDVGGPEQTKHCLLFEEYVILLIWEGCLFDVAMRPIIFLKVERGNLVFFLLSALILFTRPPASVHGEGGMAMQVTIRIRPEVARTLHQRQPATPAAEELFQVVEELGVALAPVHPGAEDPQLAPYFTIEVPDHATAEQVIARLQQCQAVEAAYLKPRDELP